MKIVDLQVIPFQVPRRGFHHGEILPETMVTQTVTKIVTDQGAEGYYFGGRGHGAASMIDHVASGGFDCGISLAWANMATLYQGEVKHVCILY